MLSISYKSVFYLALLGFCIIFLIVRQVMSKDRSQIWSPLTFFSLIFLYYIVLPAWGDLNLYGANVATQQHLFYEVALLFFICIIVGFSIKTKSSFSKWNSIFSTENIFWLGGALFIFALVCYVPFRGFRYTIAADDAIRVSSRTGLISYLIDLISLFCASCGLLLINIKFNYKKARSWIVFLVVVYLSIVAYVVGGFRMRIVWLIITLLTLFHLSVKVRRPNLILIVTISVIAYIGFAIMDTTRNYGQGIDLDAASELSAEDVRKGASENVDVCCFSIATLDYSARNHYRIGFEPIITAALMPIPRTFFPWKPNGMYIREIQVLVAGDDSDGAAFLVFVEAFLAFGWIGVVLYGLFIGWLAGVFWRNYQNNKGSIGAVLLLALFNGFCYDWISRGYMAGIFNNFIYFVIMPFWLSQLLIFLKGLFFRQRI